eukprot:4029567-Karenia_brevis.AAC.1
MDEEALKEVVSLLGSVPILINAGAVSAASRPRLFWVSSDIVLKDGESLTYHGLYHTLHLKEWPSRLQVLEPGRKFHPEFPGQLFCITGWVPRTQPPP